MTPAMKALVALIIAMGIAILVALAMVAYGIVSGVGEAGRDGFGARDFELPEGCHIAASDLRENRILLRLDGPSERGCQQVVLIDAESGALLGRLVGR